MPSIKYFITAIGTDSGKTVVSAIFCEALQATYWKPIQCGFPKDSDTIHAWCPNIPIQPETYLFKTPASPHAAAALEEVTIRLSDIPTATGNQTMVVEGAGGCLVPLNEHDFIIDLCPHLGAEAILVSNLYLGSINHTLLTYEAMKKRNVPLRFIVFNGTRNAQSESIILHHTSLIPILYIDQEAAVDGHVIDKYSSILKKNLHELT